MRKFTCFGFDQLAGRRVFAAECLRVVPLLTIAAILFAPIVTFGQDLPDLEPVSMTGDPMPAEAALFQNHPNPFNPRTKIRFALPEEAYVTLVVYDVRGRLVARLVDRTLPAGYHNVPWDAGNATSGVYFYRIVSGSLVETRRMVLLK